MILSPAHLHYQSCLLFCEIGIHQRPWTKLRESTTAESRMTAMPVYSWVVGVYQPRRDRSCRNRVRLTSDMESCSCDSKRSAKLFFRFWTLITCLYFSVNWNVEMGVMHTSSIESFIMNRVVVTFFVWPNRWMRANACSSSVGFHWGSIRYAWVAAVKFSLREFSVGPLINTWFSYPSAPQEIESRSTLMLGSSRNWSNAIPLFFEGTRPSTRTKGIGACSSIDCTRSRVVVQEEKTTLLTLAWIRNAGYYLVAIVSPLLITVSS